MTPDEIEKVSLPLLLELASTLPASPRVFARLSKLLDNDDASLDYIASLVKMDPGLAAQILRATNSAYYGAAVKVHDLETAISRIGFTEVHKVMSMVVTHDCFYQALPTYGITAAEFADESINAAVVSEALAKRIGVESSAPYLAGLLHCIGRLAIDLYIEKHKQAIDLASLAKEKPIDEVETEILGITAWRAGSELLRHWQFEPEIWQPIKNQISPKNSPSQVRPTALLTAAVWIAQQVKGGYDFEAELPIGVKWALSKLALDPLDVPMLIDDARFEINDRKNLFSMLL